MTEQALGGGRQTQGVIRVGQTVRRALHERSDYVHALLRHLEAVGFDGAPRLLGIDAQGREVLAYLPGEVIVRSPAWLSDARLDSAAQLIRRFHDATAGSSLAGDRRWSATATSAPTTSSSTARWRSGSSTGTPAWPRVRGWWTWAMPCGAVPTWPRGRSRSPSRPARCGACATPTAGPRWTWSSARSATAFVVPAISTPRLGVPRAPPSSTGRSGGWTRRRRR